MCPTCAAVEPRLGLLRPAAAHLAGQGKSVGHVDQRQALPARLRRTGLVPGLEAPDPDTTPVRHLHETFPGRADPMDREPETPSRPGHFIFAIGNAFGQSLHAGHSLRGNRPAGHFHDGQGPPTCGIAAAVHTRILWTSSATVECHQKRRNAYGRRLICHRPR